MFSSHSTLAGGDEDGGDGDDDGDPILQRVSTLVREYISSD